MVLGVLCGSGVMVFPVGGADLCSDFGSLDGVFSGGSKLFKDLASRGGDAFGLEQDVAAGASLAVSDAGTALCAA